MYTYIYILRSRHMMLHDSGHRRFFPTKSQRPRDYRRHRPRKFRTRGADRCISVLRKLSKKKCTNAIRIIKYRWENRTITEHDFCRFAGPWVIGTLVKRRRRRRRRQRPTGKWRRKAGPVHTLFRPVKVVYQQMYRYAIMYRTIISNTADI